MRASLVVLAVHAAISIATTAPALAQLVSSDWERWKDKLQASAKSQSDSGRFAEDLRYLATKLNDKGEISSFRSYQHDDEIVKSLVPLARSEDRTLRLHSTLILANIVDNTNVCYILSDLVSQSDLNVNGQYNLLQIVNVVASYANEDNRVWIAKALDVVDRRLGTSNDFAKTTSLSREIRRKIDSLSTQTMGKSFAALSAETKRNACLESLKSAGLM